MRRDDVTCTSHRHKEGDTNLDFELLKLCSFVSMCTSHIDAERHRMDAGGERVTPTRDSRLPTGMVRCGAVRCDTVRGKPAGIQGQRALSPTLPPGPATSLPLPFLIFART